MRVLHVQETLAPNYGGPAKLLPQLARAQAAHGLDVEILTTNADTPRGRYCDPGRSFLPDSNVPVTYCSAHINALRISGGIMSYMHRFARSFDIVHVHGLYRFPQGYAGHYARRNNIPLIIRPHGSLDPYLFARSSHNIVFKRIFEKFVVMPNLRFASAIHYTAEDERERASFLGLKTPSFVVPNGLDWAPYANLPPRGSLRTRLGIGDAPLILFLGRLHRKKGLDILVDAFDTVHRANPAARLVIAGPENDEYGAEVRGWVRERGLQDSVLFAGSLYGADVIRAYVDADIFALPSYTENFGMTVVEAMACGLPVVISDQVNIHPQISEAGAGIVTRCNADEVAAALLNLLGDTQRRLALGEAGRKLSQGSYGWPAIIRSLNTEYEKILSRHS